MELLGIHHLTAISAEIRENKRFFTETLGMRLVKRSVNQDDVSAYHLFYADALGSPGTDITFFDWPMPSERRGGRSVTRTALRVDGANGLDYWTERFDQRGVRYATPTVRDSRLTLDFEDGEGQRLALIDDGGAGAAHPWNRSPVPEQHQIRGLGPITMSIPDLAATDVLLQQVMGFRPVRTYPLPDSPNDIVHVYEMGDGGTGAELHVAVQPGLQVAVQGAGGVHHVAFRSADADYDAWANRLVEMRIPNSGKVDRFWFQSLYFREPNGVLFEIATDGPGFGVDEEMVTLGEKVVLPPSLEPHRAEIVANLKSID